MQSHQRDRWQYLYNYFYHNSYSDSTEDQEDIWACLLGNVKHSMLEVQSGCCTFIIPTNGKQLNYENFKTSLFTINEV